MNLKTLSAFIGALVILGILFAGSVYLKNHRQPITSIIENSQNKPGITVVDNKEFGYRFEIDNKFFQINNQSYKANRDGYYVSYYLKTIDPEWTKDGNNYAEVLTIGAVATKEVESKKEICAKNDVNMQDSPFDCLAFDQPLGHNKYFTFVKIPHIEQYPKDFEEIQLYEAIIESLKNIKIYDPSKEPSNLHYDDYLTGFSFDYPAYLDRALFNLEKYVDMGASVEIDKNLYVFATKKIYNIIPVKYCALSGKCQPNTLNFSINIGDIDLTKGQLLNSDVGKSLTTEKIGSKTVYVYKIGAEGEGINFYFIEGPQNKMYGIAWKYINEQIISKYKTAPGFKSYQDQKTITENIIRSFKFNEPINHN